MATRLLFSPIPLGLDSRERSSTFLSMIHCFEAHDRKKSSANEAQPLLRSAKFSKSNSLKTSSKLKALSSDRPSQRMRAGGLASGCSCLPTRHAWDLVARTRQRFCELPRSQALSVYRMYTWLRSRQVIERICTQAGAGASFGVRRS